MAKIDLTAFPYLTPLMAEFTDRGPKHRELRSALERILRRVAAKLAPGSKAEARCKTKSSFAEKCLRKKYKNPFEQMTDLVGGRIVAYTHAQTDAVCRWIEDQDGVELEIDWANTVNTLNRLRAGEFGYLARHYIVCLKGPTVQGVAVDATLRTIKCEIQVCTYLEHVWAAIGHDRLYKTGVKPPKAIERKLAVVMAMLEASDDAFGVTISVLDRYIGSFQAHFTPAQIEEELKRQQAVLEVDEKGLDAVRIRHRIGQLHLADGNPQQAMRELQTAQTALDTWNKRILSEGKDATELSEETLPREGDVLRDLARAAIAAGNVELARECLARAIALDRNDCLAHLLTGGTYLVNEPKVALEHYARAHAISAEEPRVLAPFVEADLRCNPSAHVLHMLRGSFLAGIAECQRRIELQVHLPDAYFEEGRLALYLSPDKPWDAMAAYCRAIAACERWQSIFEELLAIGRIVTAFTTAAKTSEGLVADKGLRGFVWVQRLLQLALIGRLTKREGKQANSALSHHELNKIKAARSSIDLESFATPAAQRPRYGSDRKPILIVAGGCDREHATAITGCKDIVDFALKGFAGTIIGGGTNVGIGKLVADAVIASPTHDRVRLMAYLPEDLPESDKKDEPRFVVVTVLEDKKEYTPLGPMQMWADLLLAGVEPSEVRLLGINGGQLSAFEFRLALAMGAIAGVVQQSGREAEKLLPDPFWHKFRGLAPLPKDKATLAAFINSAHPDVLKAQPNAEAMAKVLHQSYREGMLKEPWNLAKNDAMHPWESLPSPFKRSNLHQAAYSIMILRRVGFDVVSMEESPSQPAISFGDKKFKDKVEEMAELEHGRFCAERLSDGWRWGEKRDSESRLNPTLVPWNSLPEEQEEKDRVAIKEFPKILKMAGLKIAPRKS